VKVTKYEHATLVVSTADQQLVIDPGMFLTPPDFANTVAVVITHEHGDHVGGLASLQGRTRSVAIPQKDIKAGDRLRFGNLTVEAIGLPGHCPGAVGYRIDGLARAACVTGDALFAGSMGGCAPGGPYQAALDALRGQVLTLTDDTVLLPGHGPETTVGSEKLGNAFLAVER